MTIIAEYKGNLSEFTYFWKPLIIKHGEVEFIFTNGDNLTGVKIANSIEEAVSISSNENIFLTDTNGIPTYETMIYLTSMAGNVCCNPVWHDYNNGITSSINGAAGKRTNSFSILKQQFTGTDFNEYVTKWNPKIVNDTSLYYIGAK